MDSIKDLLRKKAEKFDDEGVEDDLHIIKEEFERHFSTSVTVWELKDNGSLIVKVKSSSMASEVRLKTHQIRQNVNKIIKNHIKRIVIRIT